MKRKEQIAWIVRYYFDNDMSSLDATNFECAFIDGTGIELSHKLWRERIRSAAEEIGLSGWRYYNWDGGHGNGIQKYSMNYS